jgi:ABC-type lipoprotein release transport system permease subunit
VSLATELAEAEWSARRSRYAALATLLAATAGASFLVLAVVNGLEESIGEEISGTLGGDLRIARGRSGLGDGNEITDLRDAMDGLRFVDPRATFAPRLETQGIFLHGADFTRSTDAEARAAAVLVGIDPAADARVTDLASIITRGEGPVALEREWRSPEGERLIPVIVGASFLENGNVTVYDGTFNWSSVYNISAGHVENGRLVRERAIVVGVYETGFKMIDRLIVYAPRGEVSRLLGGFATNPSANVILAASPDPAALADHAEELGYVTLGAGEFRESYLGPIFVSVRLAAWSIVALLVLMTAGWMGYTLAHHVHEDRRKIATLRAVGIPDKVIARTYLMLAGALTLASTIFGFGGAMLLALVGVLAARFTDLIIPRPAILDGLALLVFSVVAALVAVRWAVARAARISIREALQAP